MPSLFAKSDLFDLIEKIEKEERLDAEDGVRLLESRDILALGYMANVVRERKHGGRTFFTMQNEVRYPNGWDAILHYGEMKGAEERITRLLKIRELQEQTGKFLAFMPLSDPFMYAEVDETGGAGSATGFEDLKMLAVSRIMLDNIEHIKTLWVKLGLKLTQVALSFGVDYVDFYVGKSLTKETVVRVIRSAGRDAVETE